MKYILGKKLGMDQIWRGEAVVPVTLLLAEPAIVLQVKNAERDGYVAVQVGFGSKKRINKAQRGHFKSLGSFQYVREFRVREKNQNNAESELPAVGAVIDVGAFKEGDVVRVTGATKGRGFQGVVKRHGFKGGPMTHGQKNRQRAPGSIGNTALQRVAKGRRMAGHMGVDRVAVKNLKIAGVDKDKNILMVTGAVPGNKGTLIEVVG